MQLLRKIAFPVSLLYALIVHLRNFLYDLNILPSEAFKTRTICVGNLSVGGTGKTPMIEMLISLLEANHRLAILSRGYGRKTKGLVRATSASSAEEIGDEPLQLVSKFPHIPVIVDANRKRGIAAIEEEIAPDFILLDDAFQHRSVRPDFSILLTAYYHPYTQDWYLPTGNLRDAKREARRADVIVITKCPETLNEEDQNRLIAQISPRDGQQVLFSGLRYARQLKGGLEGQAVEALKGLPFVLVTAIANPVPLVEHLKGLGLDFQHISYRDHHYFSAGELKLFASKDRIITTEKDYMRLKGKLKNVSYIPVSHYFFKDGRQKLIAALGNLRE